MSHKNKFKLKPFYHDDHPRPVTRRELLGQGFTLGVGWAATPSLVSLLLSRRAFGQDTCDSGSPQSSAGMAGFIGVELAGGASIAGSNVIVFDRRGQLLGDYSSLGLPSDMHPGQTGQINDELGLPFHADSGILRGILQTTTPDTRSKVDGCVICTSSADDTSNNALATAAGVALAGAAGDLVRLVGVRSSPSGARSKTPFSTTGNAVVIRNPDDARGLVTPGKLEELFTKESVDKLLATIKDMSLGQLRAFNKKKLPEQLNDLVRCGYIKAPDLIKNDPDNVDPREDDLITSIFNNMTAASLSYLVLKRQATAGTFEMGGFDYHTSNRSKGEERDLKAGILIGKMLQAAAVLQRRLMIHVYTDGGVVAGDKVDNSEAGRGKLVWRGDSGQRSAAFVLVFDPDGRPTLRNNKRQLGAYKEAGGGSVDNSVNKISNSPANQSVAVLANYLAWHGEEARLDEVVSDNPFTASDLEDYLFMEKKG